MKVSTTEMKRLPGIHATAGEIAGTNGYPWWAAWAYAGSVLGSTDAVAVHEAAIAWLQGWSRAYKLIMVKEQPPPIVAKIIETPMIAYAIEPR